MVVFMVTLNYLAQLAPLEAAAKKNEWYGTESHECVALVKPWIPGKITKQWKRGAQVKGNKFLATGTCIASFQYSPSKGYFYNEGIKGKGAIQVQDYYCMYGVTICDRWKAKTK
ncbi:BPSL0067_family protein [Hexamita inflata]|uniref:BPSL0067 family protein n=1 Tax=Hexamita inflata TaxID=28002 RepID=A0AA86QVS0_9EUKA|nr:BPSL0067 family protein [Hexamita inflata]